MRPKPSLLLAMLHLTTLFCLSAAQPLLDLLARHAEFFVARQSESVDLWLLAGGLCLGVPALTLLVLTLLLPTRLRRLVFALLVALLFAVLVMQWLGRLTPGIVTLAGSATAGGAFAYVYHHRKLVRSFVTALAPALVLCPALFLFHPQIRKLAFPAFVTAHIGDEVASQAPVVFVIFDEFPLISLLDENRRIDAVRFPHFAALARDSTWFRNATTVSPATSRAVPAILTGNYADWSRLPILADHPCNLFTLLDAGHELKVTENVTRLCPPRWQKNGRESKSLARRLGELSLDLLVVSGHVFLPPEWARSLPSVTQDWREFAPCCEPAVNWEERPRQFEAFVDSIRPGDRPVLYFTHVLLPHSPFCFLPSGKFYGRDLGVEGLRVPESVWNEEETAVVHSHQRHLLQVGYVDRLLGKLLTRLKETGLYDKALIVVVADHGISFRPGRHYREVTPDTFADILRVPFFIKTPYQTAGVVNDRNVQTIDVLPTVADALGVTLGEEVDGRSAFGRDPPERGHKVLIARDERWTFPAQLDGDFGGLDRQLRLFGSGSWDQVYRAGPNSALVGRLLKECSIGESSRLEIELDPAGSREHDPRSSFAPCRLRGVVRYAGDRPLELAVAVNGRIEAMTRTYEHQGNVAKVAIMLPEAAFLGGSNEIDLLLVSGDGTGQQVLRRCGGSGSRSADYALSNKHGQEKILLPSGEALLVWPGKIKGRLDRVHLEGGGVEFLGWAADLQRVEAAETIVLLADGQCLVAARPNADRADVARHYGEPALQWCGFRFSFPAERLQRIGNPQVRAFAVSKQGAATELAYPPAYKKSSLRPLLQVEGSASN